MDMLLRPLAGAEDLLLLEAGAPDPGIALALLARVAWRADGAPIDWTALVPTDVDVLLLRLRQMALGDFLRAAVVCPVPSCAAPVDVAFSIDDYVDHHRSRMPRGIVPGGEEGWYRLSGMDVEFRLPRTADQLAIVFEPRPADALCRRCIRGAEITAGIRRRVEAAMEALAPSLCSPLHGRCPECGATVEVSFDPLQYALKELRDQASFIYEEVYWIAQKYHWSEAEILALPAARRARYAELAQREGRAA
jgi:hypothetical protein